MFDAVTGAQTGSYRPISERARLFLHPSELTIYSASTVVTPSDIERYDLLPGGSITRRWDSPYHGEHRMDGDVWASPLGDVVVTRGGDVFTVGATQATDMRYVSALSEGPITSLAWDAPRSLIYTIEGSAIHFYDLASHQPLGALPLGGPGAFVGTFGGLVFGLRVKEPVTTIQVFTGPPIVRAETDRGVD